MLVITKKSSLKRQLKAEAPVKKSSSEDGFAPGQVVLSTSQGANNTREFT